MNTMQRFLGGVSFKNFVNNGSIFTKGSYANGITARAGGGQALATAMTAQFNSVDTVVTAADSVKLPAPSAERE